LESLTLFKNYKERKLFFFILLLVFIFNIYIEFLNYKNITKNEISQVNGTILNIYKKDNYDVLKIKTKDFTFFTSTQEKIQIKLFQDIQLYIVTKEITFFSFLQNFYTKSFNIRIIPNTIEDKQKVHKYIESQHKNNDISSLYNALFLASPLTVQVRQLASEFGISHLIAISGFHLGIISLVLYFIIHSLYKKIHQKFCPYRNKKFDITLMIALVLLSYLIFIDIPPSLLRAFVMFIFALFMLRNNIQLISFETLFIISVLIIAFFPKLLFSLSLWFSITGVFYIFLFIKYFKNLNKYFLFVLFNFWLYLAINPITHYFFATTTLEQLYSPLLTILFSLFYPLSFLLHIFNFGGILDDYMVKFLSFDISSIEVFTPSWFFVVYIIISLISITQRNIFILLNILFICYNIWLFSFIV